MRSYHHFLSFRNSCLYLLITAICCLSTMTEESCYVGTYVSSKPPWGSCSGYSTCEIGHYCLNGKKYLCPTGTYGDISGLSNATCSGLCPSGYYCPAGTAFPFSYKCGNYSVYCPEGSGKPLTVPKGYYSIGSGVTNSEIMSDILICPKGSYCADGVKHLCPSGTYGLEIGLTSSNCSGICPEGWYCPTGTITYLTHSCNLSPKHYCPAGSTHPLNADGGHYAIRSHISEGGGYGGIKPCPLGHYCLDGIKYTCPGGRFGNITLSINASCSGACLAGYYCPEGSIRSTEHLCGSISLYCPPGSAAPIPVSAGYYSTGDGSTVSGTKRLFALPYDELLNSSTVIDFNIFTRTSQSLCEPGYYCIGDGLPRLCAPGYYGSSYGLSSPSASCDGPCHAGYQCPVAGSTTPTYLPCGAVHFFCPIGTITPQLVHGGYYTVGDTPMTRYAERRCEPGWYCQNGVKSLCLPGFYGDVFGNINANCSGVCSEGYYCPEGSTSPNEVMCGDPGRYCPGNNPHPLTVPVGHYSTGGNVSTRVAHQIAPRGSYAVLGILFLCPAGTYGSQEGLSTASCSGKCKRGYYCPAGSTSPVMFGCGSPNVYCPSSATAPVPVLPGRYTIDWTVPCGPGYYRNFTAVVDVSLPGPSLVTTEVPLPECQPCPPGTYKYTDGNDFASCRRCPPYSTSTAGQSTCSCYSPSGGLESVTVGDHLYYNVTSGRCEIVSPEDFQRIDYSEWLSGWRVTQYQQHDCEPGHYCISGVRYHCPPGTYGSQWRETRPQCEGQCSAGYFCPLGSANSTAFQCGGPDLYCPEGSFEPIIVPPGYYSDPTVSSAITRYSILQCPPGHWCQQGLKYECPPGSYGSSYGLSEISCDGLCEPGYYCEAASTSPFAHECGNSTVYCPRGSFAPKSVHSGFYAAYGTISGGASVFWNNNNNKTCSVELPCEPGYFCTGGIKQPCPPGTFGWRYGLNSSSCSGRCAKGHYCPSYLSPLSDAPPATIWPGKPQLNAAEFECGSVELFCAVGSFYPRHVDGGYYTIGGGTNNRTRDAQVICPPGTFCVGGISKDCPKGWYGETSGLANEKCTGFCPAGYYCPQRTAQPISCPPYHYSAGGVWVCAECAGAATLTTNLTCQDSRSCCFKAGSNE